MFNRRQYRIVKEFGGNNQSRHVYLLKNTKPETKHNPKYVVEKYIDKQVFQNEIENMRHVSKCDFVPKVISCDANQGVFHMTYCGKTPDKWTPELKAEVKRKLDILKTQYGMKRPRWSTAYFSGIPRLVNVTIDSKGKVNLIDFGKPWTYDAKRITVNK